MDDVQAGRLLAPFGFTASGYRYLALRRSTAVQTRLDIFCNWLQAQARAMPEAPAVQGISITHAGNFAATPKIDARIAVFGEVDERFKSHAWKACVG